MPAAIATQVRPVRTPWLVTRTVRPQLVAIPIYLVLGCACNARWKQLRGRKLSEEDRKRPEFEWRIDHELTVALKGRELWGLLQRWCTCSGRHADLMPYVVHGTANSSPSSKREVAVLMVDATRLRLDGAAHFRAALVMLKEERERVADLQAPLQVRALRPTGSRTLAAQAALRLWSAVDLAGVRQDAAVALALLGLLHRALQKTELVRAS